MKKKLLIIITFLQFVILTANAQQRFPKPDFETGHVPPATQVVQPRSLIFEYLDVAVMIAAMSLISYFVLKRRSRKAVFWISVFSVIYFGFLRLGCVCPVGSIQNVTFALFEPTYVIPISVILFFIVPLIFALFFGRSFCSGVCFMGALQELVIIKSVKIPSWIQKTLGVIPYLYLSLAILFAATGSDFIVCRYDPFIGFFRLNATLSMYIFGIIILATGVFVARPYCRFLCPYGVLLNWMSHLSKYKVTVTPAECIQCKLCENACPVQAIDFPVENTKREVKGTRRLLYMIVLIPVFMAAGGFFFSLFYQPLSYVHPKVRLADEISNELKTGVKSASQEAIAFNSSGTQIKELYNEAAKVQSQYYKGTWIIGIILGLIFSIALINTSTFRPKKDYEANKGNCVSCARCFSYCPIKKQT